MNVVMGGVPVLVSVFNSCRVCCSWFAVEVTWRDTSSAAAPSDWAWKVRTARSGGSWIVELPVTLILIGAILNRWLLVVSEVEVEIEVEAER